MKDENRAIVLRLPESLLERLDDAVWTLRFRSRTALLRHFILHQLLLIERQASDLLERATAVPRSGETEP